MIDFARQVDAFSDDAPLNVRPPASEPTASQEAADSMAGFAANLRGMVFLALAAAPEGLTCEEVQDQLGLDGNTVRPRLWELTGQAHGYEARIVKGLATRKNRSGRVARVYRVLVCT